MITIEKALKRTNIIPNSEMTKTIGRRAARSFRARYGEDQIIMVQEGRYKVNGYPDSFKSQIIQIAKKYMTQHGKELVIEKRKRKTIKHLELIK
jgi:hypothetical protein